jgi:hypothetical protein
LFLDNNVGNNKKGGIRKKGRIRRRGKRRRGEKKNLEGCSDGMSMKLHDAIVVNS